MTVTYEAIQSYTLSGTTTQISLTSLPSTYTDLVLIATGTSSSLAAMVVQVNTDTGSNYSFTQIQGDGSSATSSRGTSVTGMNMGLIDTTISNSIIQFMNYANTTTFKTFLSRANDKAFATRANVGLWRSTSAINSIQLSGSTFQNGFTVNVYGIKAE
jgi:hypothetical protein